MAKLVRVFGKHSQCPRESRQMQGHPRLHDEVQANVAYMAGCLKTAQQKTKTTCTHEFPVMTQKGWSGAK